MSVNKARDFLSLIFVKIFKHIFFNSLRMHVLRVANYFKLHALYMKVLIRFLFLVRKKISDVLNEQNKLRYLIKAKKSLIKAKNYIESIKKIKKIAKNKNI